MKLSFLLLLSTTISFTVYAQHIPGACGNAETDNSKSHLPHSQDGNGSLGQIYNNSACGLDYVQATNLVETRSQQYSINVNGTGLPSTLAITGLPDTYIIDSAYLWMICSYKIGSSATPAVSITNPSSNAYNYTGLVVGDGPPKCWGGDGTRVFRINVTSCISGNGNYRVDVSGFVDKNWETDGITLIVIYKDPAALYYGSLLIHDGNMTGNWGNNTQIISGINSPCTNSTSANGFVLVSDMQENVNSGMHPSTINGATKDYSNDFFNFDTDTTTVSASQTSAIFGTDGLGSDCFTFLAAGLYYQTTNCVDCGCSSEIDVVHDTCSSCGGAVEIMVSGGTSPYAYLWDENAGGQTNASISGLCAGVYEVTITDQGDCELHESVEVKLIDCTEPVIPSAFTPNADGVNDVWVIRGLEDAPDCLVEVYNRWGSVIFQSKGYAVPWDGTFNGKPLPSGVYYYTLNMGNGKTYNGSVTIVR